MSNTTLTENLSLQIELQPDEPTLAPLRKLHLLYHELRASESRYSYVMNTAMFEKHTELYADLRNGHNISLWPELTFDDGHISNSELAAPILQSRGLTAQFFITVGWTAKKSGYMGWSELQSLHDAGHRIGAHGWTHTLLTHCNDADLRLELEKSRLTLEDKLGISVTTMSLPGGRGNRRVLVACLKAGYKKVYTSFPKSEQLPFGTTVGRLNILGDMQPEWIAKLLEPNEKLLSSLGRQYRIKDTTKLLLGDGLYEKLWALVNSKEPESDDGQEIPK